MDLSACARKQDLQKKPTYQILQDTMISPDRGHLSWNHWITFGVLFQKIIGEESWFDLSGRLELIYQHYATIFEDRCLLSHLAFQHWLSQSRISNYADIATTLFPILDRDEDGYIQFNEFGIGVLCAFFRQRSKGPPTPAYFRARRQLLFRSYDVDADGVLSRLEWEAFLHDHMQKATNSSKDHSNSLHMLGLDSCMAQMSVCLDMGEVVIDAEPMGEQSVNKLSNLKAFQGGAQLKAESFWVDCRGIINYDAFYEAFERGVVYDRKQVIFWDVNIENMLKLGIRGDAVASVINGGYTPSPLLDQYSIWNRWSKTIPSKLSSMVKQFYTEFIMSDRDFTSSSFKGKISHVLSSQTSEQDVKSDTTERTERHSNETVDKDYCTKMLDSSYASSQNADQKPEVKNEEKDKGRFESNTNKHESEKADQTVASFSVDRFSEVSSAGPSCYVTSTERSDDQFVIKAKALVETKCLDDNEKTHCNTKSKELVSTKIETVPVNKGATWCTKVNENDCVFLPSAASVGSEVLEGVSEFWLSSVFGGFKSSCKEVMGMTGMKEFAPLDCQKPEADTRVSTTASDFGTITLQTTDSFAHGGVQGLSPAFGSSEDGEEESVASERADVFRTQSSISNSNARVTATTTHPVERTVTSLISSSTPSEECPLLPYDKEMVKQKSIQLYMKYCVPLIYGKESTNGRFMRKKRLMKSKKEVEEDGKMDLSSSVDLKDLYMLLNIVVQYYINEPRLLKLNMEEVFSAASIDHSELARSSTTDVCMSKNRTGTIIFFGSLNGDYEITREVLRRGFGVLDEDYHIEEDIDNNKIFSMAKKKVIFIFTGNVLCPTKISIKKVETTLEVLMAVLSLKAMFNNKVYFVRGRNEFVKNEQLIENCVETYGIQEGKKVWNRILDLCEFLPFGAFVGSAGFIYGGCLTEAIEAASQQFEYVEKPFRYDDSTIQTDENASSSKDVKEIYYNCISRAHANMGWLRNEIIKSYIIPLCKSNVEAAIRLRTGYDVKWIIQDQLVESTTNPGERRSFSIAKMYIADDMWSLQYYDGSSWKEICNEEQSILGSRLIYDPVPNKSKIYFGGSPPFSELGEKAEEEEFCRFVHGQT